MVHVTKEREATEVDRHETSYKSTDNHPYEGTVRVVTEADIKSDPRLVAASVVVGQLYDFSNLKDIKEEAAAENTDALNKIKDQEPKE